MKTAQHITKAKGAYANSIRGKRRRGNPNWGKPLELELGSLPIVVCQFDQKLEELKLPTWADAKEDPRKLSLLLRDSLLRRWCERNAKHYYIPEALLDKWAINVEIT